MSEWIVVLTGGIGSGKSAVATCFEERNIEIVEQDEISREIVEPGTAALSQIVEHFGAEILSKDGSLDRAQLRARVFENLEDRRWLERLTHPLIGQYTTKYVNEARSEYVIVVNPLMRSRPPGYHRVLVVDVPQDVQIARTVARDSISQDLAKTMIEAQLDRESRLALADDVIVNDGALADLAQEVERIHQSYLKFFRKLGAQGEDSA